MKSTLMPVLRMMPADSNPAVEEEDPTLPDLKRTPLVRPHLVLRLPLTTTTRSRRVAVVKVAEDVPVVAMVPTVEMVRAVEVAARTVVIIKVRAAEVVVVVTTRVVEVATTTRAAEVETVRAVKAVEVDVVAVIEMAPPPVRRPRSTTHSETTRELRTPTKLVRTPLLTVETEMAETEAVETVVATVEVTVVVTAMARELRTTVSTDLAATAVEDVVAAEVAITVLSRTLTPQSSASERPVAESQLNEGHESAAAIIDKRCIHMPPHMTRERLSNLVT